MYSFGTAAPSLMKPEAGEVTVNQPPPSVSQLYPSPFIYGTSSSSSTAHQNMLATVHNGLMIPQTDEDIMKQHADLMKQQQEVTSQDGAGSSFAESADIPKVQMNGGVQKAGEL